MADEVCSQRQTTQLRQTSHDRSHALSSLRPSIFFPFAFRISCTPESSTESIDSSASHPVHFFSLLSGNFIQRRYLGCGLWAPSSSPYSPRLYPQFCTPTLYGVMALSLTSAKTNSQGPHPPYKPPVHVIVTTSAIPSVLV